MERVHERKHESHTPTQRCSFQRCDVAKRRLSHITSLRYSWSWLSVKTSARDALPIVWLMVYSSSLYNGFSCEQTLNEDAVGGERQKTCRTSMAIPRAPCVYGLSLRGLRLLSDPRGKQSQRCLRMPRDQKYSTVKCHTRGYAPSSLLFSSSAPVYVHVRVTAAGRKDEYIHTQKKWRTKAVIFQ